MTSENRRPSSLRDPEVTASDEAGASGVWLVTLLLVAAGCVRFWRLGAQVFGGDEGHLLWAAFEGRFPSLLFTYPISDFSLPMASLARGYLLATGHLDGWILRSLPLSFGLLLVAAPLAFREEVGGRSVAIAWSALLAVSPLLVVYSRIARSYVPATALGLLVALLLAAWRRRPRPATGTAAASAGALAIWFHPLVLLLPWTSFAVGALAPNGRGAVGVRVRTLAPWTLLLAALCALFLVPGAPSLTTSVADKQDGGAFSAESAEEALRLLVGHPSSAVVWIFLALAAWGAAVCWRRARELALLSFALVLTQSALVVGTAPTGIESARVAARYLLPVWPWALWWVAAALTAGFEAILRGTRRARLVPLAGAGVAAALLVAGPLVSPASAYSSFLHQSDWLGFTRPWRTAARLPIPESYAWLEGQPGALIEFPVHEVWAQAVAVPNYQRVHRHPVLISRPKPPWDRAALRLAANVRPDPAAFLAAPARFLVLHRDPLAEEAAVLAYLRPRASRVWTGAEALRESAGRMELDLRRLWGDPAREDPQVAIWDLERVRARLAPREGRG